jgi:serine/threonine-protein kinase
MAYRLLSGRLPFDHEDLVRLMVQIREQTPAPLARLLPNLPPHVDAAIRRALSKKKEERFATVQDFVRALDGLPSAHLAMQPAAPSAGAPTLLLPQVAMPGTVLSVPEPVLYELSKRLRVASLPTAAVAVPASRGEGAKKAESPLQTRRSPPLALQRPRRPTPALSPWRAVAALVLGAGLSLLGTLAVGRRGSREAVEGVNKVAPGPRPTEPAPMPPPSEPGGQGATADRAQAGRASPASPASPASSKHGRGGARPTRWGSGRSEGNLALVIPYAQAMPPKPEPAPPGDRAEAEVTPKATLAPAESPPRVSMVD